MPGRNSAREWLIKAYHDLSSARILYAAHHYTDTIGIDLQQAIEKTLKSLLAYENKPIKKTHNLIELYELVSDRIEISEDQIKLLALATSYYIHDRYPVSSGELPSRRQIQEIMELTAFLFERVCRNLDIELNELT